jgi:DNA-binding response OmpR family regulator
LYTRGRDLKGLIVLTKTSYRLLYVEDEDFIRENALLFLEEHFEDIYEADNAISALSLYHDKKPDIIITDISMPKMSGLELCEKIRQSDQSIPIIITTAHTHTDYLLKAVELQLIKYLLKPIQEEELLKALSLCVERLQNNNSNIIKLTTTHTYDTFNQTLFYHDSIVKLTQQERLFLQLLLKDSTHIYTYNEIENYIFPEGMSEDALKTLVKNVRKKTEKSLIENHSKIGYKINLS